MTIDAVLFDLDGTLADTAPDLVAVLNRMLAETSRPPMPYALARNEVSHGAVGLLRLGFGLAPDAEIEPSLRQRFLDLYERNGHSNSRLFIYLESINDLVSRLDCRWGIVTNKPASLTAALLHHLAIASHAGSVVSGDSLPERKPHPAPLLYAAEQLGAEAKRCVYLGDAERDIVAGRAAGMQTVATSYGYIRADEDVTAWNADAIVTHPRKILPMLLDMSERT